MEDIYSTSKINFHPGALQQMREGKQPYPLLIHLMPENGCNQNCLFCSYRMEGNKNNQLFDCQSHIPLDILRHTLKDFEAMSGRAVEITGGGEPLLYPHKEKMFEDILHRGFDYALVTNGTLLTEELAKEIAPRMTWARVSIDAATDETYGQVRRAPPEGLQSALEAVRLLRKHSRNPEFRLGVGFVVNNINYREILAACRLAAAWGADNIRISAVFHPEGEGYFGRETLTKAHALARTCASVQNDSFRVYNLFDERVANLRVGKQDYHFCGTKELLCVIGGDCNVYTCCSLAFHPSGLIGSLKDKPLKALWDSEEKREMFRRFDASKVCNYMCLYESRNKYINALLAGKAAHVNFI